MTTNTTANTSPLPQEQMGPAEKLLDLVLNSSAHLWHNRPGVDIGGTWHPKKGSRQGTPVSPGLHVPAAERLYAKLIELYELNHELAARFASYALTETDWRDLKVACAALMLIQPRSGQPIMDDDGSVAFHDDDYRVVGESMLLHYKKKSTRMLTPKAVLRVAELLETESIVTLNRVAGFADAGGGKPPMGRWPKAATRWLELREKNEPMLSGLVRAGYKETIKKLARKVGYKPESERFFAILGWKQKQSKGGHRELGLSGLELEKSDRFDGLSEAEICEAIATQGLSYKQAVGRLPKDVGMTPAIMVTLLPSLSDRDLRQLTPTLEDLGLMSEPEVYAAWEKAVESATDQRALNIAKNVQTKAIKEKLESAAEHAIEKAVASATAEAKVHVMFLIDRSGSMQGAIDKSIEVLSRILAGFPLENLHIASFDTMGWVHRPKATSRAAVQHMLGSIKAEGGTVHGAGIRALYRAGVRIPKDEPLIVIVVGDEAGEQGRALGGTFHDCGYTPAALALVLNVAWRRGETMQQLARALGVPFSTVTIEQFDDPYQVPRVLEALLQASTLRGGSSFGLVERVMQTKLLGIED